MMFGRIFHPVRARQRERKDEVDRVGIFANCKPFGEMPVKFFPIVLVVLLVSCAPQTLAPPTGLSAWPSNLPRYDHIVIVVEENKDFKEIIKDCDSDDEYCAKYVNTVLRKYGRKLHKYVW